MGNGRPKRARALPTETDQPQISYTYLSQCSLSDLLKERARGVQNLLSNETNCAILIIGLALAIKYLNSNSVSNLDLKPNNIFINDLGYPMISDYWNESLIQTKATVSMPIETDVYKCPDVSQSNDLYSFGLILYEILVGKPVYPEIVDQETLNTIFLMGERPAIPSTIHPEVASIISKCWNGIDRNSLSFSDIFDILKSINYKITPNVDCDRVEEIIRFIDPSISPLIRFSNGNDEDQSNNQSMTIKVRSWDGRYYPINVSFSDTLYEIRQRISQKTGISVEDIALSENYDRPLCCCWDCTYGKEVKFKEIVNWVNYESFKEDPKINLLMKVKARINDYPQFQYENYIKPYRSYPCMPPTNGTYFYFIPGTVADLKKKITDKNHNLFYIEGCSFNLEFNGRLLNPNDNVYDCGIKFDSTIDVIMDWPTTIKIDGNPIRCNLKDPLPELIWRYSLTQTDGIRGIPMLEKGFKRYFFSREESIEACGITSNDELTFCNQFTRNSFLTSKYSNGPFLYFKPFEDVKYVKFNYMLVTRTWCPIGEMLIAKNGFPTFRDEGNVTETGIFDFVYFEVTRRLKLYMIGDVEY